MMAAAPGVVLDLQRVDDVVDQHVGVQAHRVLRPDEDVDRAEGLEGVDGADDPGEEDGGGEQRHRHAPEARPGPGPVDARRLEQLVGHRLQPGQT